MAIKNKIKLNYLLSPGHRACAGCGQMLAARHILEVLGKNTIVVCATGCLEVVTSLHPQSAWGVPWLHSLFENAASVATGVAAALRRKNSPSPRLSHQGRGARVAVFAGDGATFDIGFGALSGMWERKDDILYVCFDNEAYMNTGHQYSGATPYAAATTTTPPDTISFGNIFNKKDLPGLAMTHGVPYVATATVGNIVDLRAKVQKALTFIGPKYLQVLVPCCPGWGYDSALTVRLAKLAQQAGLYPIFEAENGKITKTIQAPKPKPSVKEYLKLQKRFSHLFQKKEGEEIIKRIEESIAENIKKWQL